MDRTINIEFRVSSTGAITGVKTINGALVSLRQGVGRSKRDFLDLGRVVDNTIATLAAGAIQKLTSRLAQIPAEMYKIGVAREEVLTKLKQATDLTEAEVSRLGIAATREAIRTGAAWEEQIEVYKRLKSNLVPEILETEGALESLGSAVVTLSQGTDTNMEQSAMGFINAMNQYKFAGEESMRVVNVMAAGVEMGGAVMGDFEQTLTKSGKKAALAKIPFEEYTAVVQVLGQNTIRGSEAGTALGNIITRLQSKTHILAKHGLADVNLKSDGFAATMEKLKPLLNDVTALNEVFGEGADTAAAILISEAEAVKDMTEKLNGNEAALRAQGEGFGTVATMSKQLGEGMAALGAEGYALFEDAIKTALALLIDLTEWGYENRDMLKDGAKMVGIATVAIGAYALVMQAGAIKTALFTAATKAATVAQRVLNNVTKAHPLGLIAAALVGLIGLYVAFRDRIHDASAAIYDWSASALQSILTIVDKFQAAAKYLPDWLGGGLVSAGLDWLEDRLEGAIILLEHKAAVSRDAAAAIREEKAETEALKVATDGAGSSAENTGNKINHLGNEVGQTAQKIAEAREKISELTAEYDRLGTTAGFAEMMQARALDRRIATLSKIVEAVGNTANLTPVSGGVRDDDFNPFGGLADDLVEIRQGLGQLPADISTSARRARDELIAVSDGILVLFETMEGLRELGRDTLEEAIGATATALGEALVGVETLGRALMDTLRDLARSLAADLARMLRAQGLALIATGNIAGGLGLLSASFLLETVGAFSAARAGTPGGTPSGPSGGGPSGYGGAVRAPIGRGAPTAPFPRLSAGAIAGVGPSGGSVSRDEIARGIAAGLRQIRFRQEGGALTGAVDYTDRIAESAGVWP